jgi:hypothetical protein
MKHGLLTFCLVLAGLGLARAQKTSDQGKPVIYHELKEGSGASDATKKAYAEDYRVIDIRTSDGFEHARLKGFSLPFQDPRPMREMDVPAKLVLAFVVTADGRVKDLRVIQSTDSRVAKHIMHLLERRTYVSARFRGVPVASLLREKVQFGGGNERDSPYFKNGMGIQGYRDR